MKNEVYREKKVGEERKTKKKNLFNKQTLK